MKLFKLTIFQSISVHRTLLLERLRTDLMELTFRNQLCALLLQYSQVRRRQDMQVLSAVLLFVANLLNTLLNHQSRSRENWEEVLDVHKNDESVADLNVVLGVEAVDDGFGDFEVPLVADVAEILEVNVIAGVR